MGKLKKCGYSHEYASFVVTSQITVIKKNMEAANIFLKMAKLENKG